MFSLDIINRDYLLTLQRSLVEEVNAKARLSTASTVNSPNKKLLKKKLKKKLNKQK